MKIKMNNGLDYKIDCEIEYDLVKQTWLAIAGQESGETIDNLCDQWPCLAVNGSAEEAKEWINELDTKGTVSGIEENLVWCITK